MDNERRLLAAALLVASGSVVAQSGPVRPQYEFPELTSAAATGMGAGSVRLGNSSFYLAPYVGAAFGHDDNLFQAPVNEQSSWLLQLTPGATIEGGDSNRVFKLLYSGDVVHYTSSSNDDYQDHAFLGTFDMRVTREAAFQIGYDYFKGHDARGSTDRASQARPDKFNRYGANLLFSYGRRDAKGRVEATYSDFRTRYQNNASTTAVSDRDTQEYGVIGYFQVMPKTQLVAEYRKSELDYTQNRLQSSQEERYYAGVTWDATALTSGTIKVGRLKKEFDASPVNDYSDTGWEAIVRWAPRTYSRFQLSTSRTSKESTGEGTFIVSDSTGLAWSHSWTTYLDTTASLIVERNKYQQTSARSDDVTMIGLKAGYKFRHWLTLGAEYRFMDRDSNQPANEFERNLWLFTASATM
jgi:hypothetical protein